MDPTLKDAVEYRLRPDEGLVWAGRPTAARHMFPDPAAFTHFAIWSFWLILTLIAAGGVFGGADPAELEIQRAAQEALQPLEDRGFLSPGRVGGANQSLTAFYTYTTGVVLALALWQLSAPLRRYWGASRLIYAVTPERGLILRGNKVTPLRSYDRPQQNSIKVVEKDDGSGDILFEPPPPGIKTLFSPGKRIYGFQGIEDVRAAAAAVEKIRADKLF